MTFEEWQSDYLKSHKNFYALLPSEQDEIIWNAATAQPSSHDEEIVRAALRVAAEAATDGSFCRGVDHMQGGCYCDEIRKAILALPIPAILQQVKAGEHS